jgi:AcrR family transcriptional regulator
VGGFEGEGLEERQRIRDAAFRLFAVRGLQSVEVEEIIAESGVSGTALGVRSPSKEALALGYLEDLYKGRRAAICAAVAARGEGPHALMGIFDVLKVLSAGSLSSGLSLVHLMMESEPGTPIWRACTGYRGRLLGLMAGLARSAGLRDPWEFSRQLQVVVNAALLFAVAGDPGGFVRCEQMAELLMGLHSAR